MAKLEEQNNNQRAGQDLPKGMAEPKTSLQPASVNRRRRVFLRWLTIASIFSFVLCVVFTWVWGILPQIAIAEISQLTNAKVDAKSIDFDLRGSVFIEEFVIKPELEQEYDNAILKAKTVYGRFSIKSLLLLAPRLKEINIEDFVCDAQFNLDTGRWNVGELKISVPKGGFGKMPLVVLENGTLRYSKISKGQTEVAMEIPIEARLGFEEETMDGYSFEVTTAEIAGSSAKSKLSGFWKPGMITIAGGMSSRDIPSFERTWMINILAGELTYDERKNYSLRLRIRDLQSTHSPEAETFGLVRPAFLQQSNPFTALQKFFDRYRPSGVIDIKLEATGNLTRLGESDLEGKIYCKDVCICYRKFPYSIEKLTGWVDFTQDSVRLNKLSGKHNGVDVTIDGLTGGFGPNWRYRILITSDNMSLDSELYDALSARQKKLWDAFNPRGFASVSYQLTRSSPTDKAKNLSVQLLGAEATYRHFPYPLKNLSGELFFDRESIIVSDVVSKVGQQRITINGKVSSRNTERPIYYISIKAKDVPFDSTVEESLPESQKNFYKQFEVRGIFDTDVKIYTPAEERGATSFLAEVAFEDSIFKIKKSAITISGMSAKALITPDLISIKELTGWYNKSEISLKGGVWFSDEAQPSRYRLRIDANKAQLDDKLIHLLPSPLDEVVFEFHPQGEIDVRADLNKFKDVENPTYQIHVNCLGDKVNFERFAYPLKDVTGVLLINNDGVTFVNIKARPDDTVRPMGDDSVIRFNGQVTFSDRLFKECNFELSAQDIFWSDELGSVSPGCFANFYKRLLPVGRFDLELERFKISSAENDSRVIDFKGTAKLKDCDFIISGSKANMNGAIETKGLWMNEGFSEGAVSIIADDFKIKGKSLTNLKVDVDYDPNEQIWSGKNLIADFYNGTLIGQLRLTGRSGGQEGLQYQFEVGFDDVDLQRFLSRARSVRNGQASTTSGRMKGSISARASVGDNALDIGKCGFIVTNMRVGKISPIAKLLQVLSLTEPKDFAFERMSVDSYIKRNRLIIEKFDMSGETLAFNGSGWMDLPSENVNLVLTARGQRLEATGGGLDQTQLRRAKPSVLESLTEGLGGAVVRMEVTGNVYDPKVETKTLPVIGDSLQIIGAGAAKAE